MVMNVTEQSQSRMVAEQSPLGKTVSGVAALCLAVFLGVSAQQKGSSVGAIVALAVAVAGVYLIVTATRTTITVDKSLGTLAVSWRSPVKSGAKTVRIADIDSIGYREFTSTEGSAYNGQQSTQRQDTSTVVLKDGGAVVLGQERTSVRGSEFLLRRSRGRELDNALAAFLGVPLVDNGVKSFPGARGTPAP